MKSRVYLVYGVFVVAACAALAVLLWNRRSAQEAEDARKYPPQQVVRIPTSTPQPHPSLPPGLTPLPPGAGPRLPGAAAGDSRPPMMGGVTQMAVVDLNTAPVSALVTLPGITQEDAKESG